MANTVPIQYDVVALAGGMDQVTPTLSLKPGFVRRSANFECSITGGYSRIAGYERFDGRSRPSNAVYVTLSVSSIGTIAVGNTVNGGTSGATGYVIAVTTTSVIVTQQVGAFVTGEDLRLVAVVQGSITNIGGKINDGLLDATYLGLAANVYRSVITEIPGSGSVLGVCWYNSKLYGFRNNVGGTAAAMYVSSASGWTLVSFGEELIFSNANINVTDGDVLTQGAVTATVRRVIVETGTLLSGVNTGRLILASRAGGNFSAGAATSTGGGTLTVSSIQTAISLLPNGSYQFVTGNFGAGSANKSVYGADGVNRAFEFDGTNFVPIRTGMTIDTPNLIAVHKQHLFLTFGYSLQFSAVGSPYMWSAVVGAGEIGMLDSITNLVILPGDQTSGALGVFTRKDTSVLYGTSSSTFALTTLNSGSGAVLNTTQNLEQTYLLNDFGVQSLATTKNFGNFDPSALTMAIRPFISERIPYAICSGISRSKGQYRVFFSDGSGLYLTLHQGAYIGAMPVDFTNHVSCITEGNDQFGNSTSYFGSTNGMVYEMDIGTSFDGEQIAATMSLVFNKMGNHRMLKRYRKASLELSGGSYIAFDIGYSLGYDTDTISQPINQTYSQYLRQSYWDSFVWDSFVWDGSDIAPGDIDLTGTAENISMRISSLSSLIKPFTLNTVTTHYTPRRGIR